MPGSNIKNTPTSMPVTTEKLQRCANSGGHQIAFFMNIRNNDEQATKLFQKPGKNKSLKQLERVVEWILELRCQFVGCSSIKQTKYIISPWCTKPLSFNVWNLSQYPSPVLFSLLFFLVCLFVSWCQPLSVCLKNNNLQLKYSYKKGHKEVRTNHRIHHRPPWCPWH